MISDNPWTVEDYINWPYQNRQGIQTEEKNNYLTRSLFLEVARDARREAMAPYTLSEHELFHEGTQRWVPSAWRIYIHADNEYDAMRKIVGNPHQWETLKKTKWFPKWLEQWEAEHLMLKKAEIEQALLSKVKEGGNGVTAAAKLLSDMYGITKPKGRPRKQEIEAGKGEDEYEEIAQRLKLVASNGD